MIDMAIEKCIPLRGARKLFPALRNRKPPDLATLYRWSVGGVRGVRLETVQIGSARCTSREAVARFIAALTASRDAQPAAERMPACARKRVEKANKEAGAIRPPA